MILQIANTVNNLWDDVNNFLAIIGLISLLLTIVRVIWALFDSNEWIDNIRIEEYPMDKDFENEKGFYPEFYPAYPSEIENEYAKQNLFIPQNTIIRKAVIKKVDFYENKKGEMQYKYKKVYVVKEISPHNPLCLVIERTESIPQYMIEWKTEYGGKGEYYFGDNLLNGDNTLNGFKYHYGLISRIRKILNLK